MHAYGYINIIDKPTFFRDESNYYKSCLDHVFISGRENNSLTLHVEQYSVVTFSNYHASIKAVFMTETKVRVNPKNNYNFFF